MSSAQRLYELQTLDLSLDALRRELEAVLAGLKEDLGVSQARAQVQEAQEQLKGLRPTQREGEMTVEELEAKVRAVERRLYGGSVRNPRELKGLEADFRYLKGRQREAEDRVLEVMAQVEEVEGRLQAAQAHLAEREEAWAREQERLHQEQGRLTSEVRELERQRQQVAEAIGAGDLALYERLRVSRGGQAVARLERDTCQGCRLALPTREAQRVRTAPTLVQCSSCGRILSLG